MSRHHFNTTYNGKAILVLMGFDRPLNTAFMDIEFLEKEDELDDQECLESGYLYTSISQPNPQELSLDDLIEVLTKHDISIPDSMLKNVRLDITRSDGARVLFYNVAGESQSRPFEQ